MSEHERAYIDSCVFLAWLKDEAHANDVGALFHNAQKNELKILTSALTIAEVLNIQGKDKTKIPRDKRDAVRKLFRHRWINIVPLTRKIAEMAQDLVWEYKIAPKDSIHVATAENLKADKLYTYDEDLIKQSPSTGNSGEIKILKPPTAKERGEFDFTPI